MSIIFSIIVSWFAFIKKVQVLRVKIITNSFDYENDFPIIKEGELVRVQVLCDGENEDIIEFKGICINKDIDEVINNPKKNVSDIVILPNDIFLPSTLKEKIEPHKLSESYEFCGIDIINALKERNMFKDEIKTTINFVYQDSKGNYFYAPLIVIKS